MIAKSRTGSGKTLAFLIPAVEMVVNVLKNKDSRDRRGLFLLFVSCPLLFFLEPSFQV